MRYLIMLVLSLAAGTGMVLILGRFLRRLKRIEQERWGKQDKD